MSKHLFRSEAAENFSSMADTTVSAKTITTNEKILSVLVFVVFVSIVIWFFTGNITETVSVSGVITTDGGNVEIYAPKDGIVSDVFVWRGERVSAGDTIAVIPDIQTLERIKNAETEEEINRLRDEYISNSIVKTLKNGIIRNVVSEGKHIDVGSAVSEMTVLEEYTDNNKIIAFIESENIQSLELGMDVQVSPEFAPREKYGYMKGYISSMGEYPESMSKLTSTYNIGELYSVLDSNKNYIELEITLIPDEDSKNGIEWSNPNGNELSVNIGTVCNGSVVVKDCKPYEWFLK